MKRLNKDIAILKHIIKYCDRIQKSLERFGRDFETFEKDNDFRDSVSMNLLQIGELAKKLSLDFRNSTEAEMEWKAIVGMRNLFAHDYGSMDIERIWETALYDIPKLKEYCEKTV